LENSWRGLDRVFLVAQSEDKGASGSLLLTHGTSAWGPFGFPKQFLGEGFCELRLYGVFGSSD
jgi:hypothetical protein